VSVSRSPRGSGAGASPALLSADWWRWCLVLCPRSSVSHQEGEHGQGQLGRWTSVWGVSVQITNIRGAKRKLWKDFIALCVSVSHINLC
jgi:hypothetical protein